ncbi:mannose-ethanolamine phosphotransferase gpi13 [Myotisia sp. PD_48]|nr:mannose-ethanolamine phosphotransferase gpi13 [Myotisia sp. PD_48]
MKPPNSQKTNEARSKPSKSGAESSPGTQSNTQASSQEFRDIKAKWAQLLAEEEAKRAAKLQRNIQRSKRVPASEAELLNAAKERDVQRNKQKEKEFKIQHAGILGLLGWIFLIHVIGIFFFTKGFLLTRLVLEDKSQCDILPFEKLGMEATGGFSINKHNNKEEGCWHPKSFDKAVVLIIDALRYDFTVPFHPTVEGQKPQIFHENIPVLYETAMRAPNNAFLLPFIADPPTTTLQRLKGLTTGTLPTFIDAGSNFAGTAIDEDNLVAQLKDAGKRVVHLGDDTWRALFPGYFEEDLSHAYDSFNVWDLHTVDNGVNEYLFPLLHPDNSTKWDIIFGHYLGVDHAGHRYGPDHSAMAEKLAEMDQVIQKVIDTIDDSTLLVVFGDHGMDSKGDHGGESDDEVQAALWMYSKKGIFGRRNNDSLQPPKTAKERAIPQIDLVPTLSLLLGLPIPFNNLGSPIDEAFSGRDGQNHDNLAQVNRLTSAQIKRYQHEYSIARGLDDSQTSGPFSLWEQAETLLRNSRGTGKSRYASTYELYREYQRDTLAVCRGLWARFDIPSMIQGIAVLSGGVVLLVYYGRAIRGDRTDISFPTLQRISIGSIIGIAGGAISSTILDIQLPVYEAAALGAAAGSILAATATIFWIPNRILSAFPNSLWGWMAFIFTVAQAAGFASNSYTIWEDQILLFFLTTFGVLAAFSSMRQKLTEDRVLGFYHSIVFIILGRVASFSRLCREEQMPYCRSTYYASDSSSTSSPLQLMIPFLLSLLLPAVIRSYYLGTKSYEGSAKFWIGFAFRMGLLMVAIFWMLDAADDGNWLTIQKTTLKSVRVILAQIILAIAFAAGTTTFVWAKPCISIGVSPRSDSAESKTSVTILGYANIYGTRYFFLLVNFTLAIILLEKPMGGGAIAIQIWQILSLMEILDTNNLSISNSPIGPVVLGLLGSFHYFTTGHQATLSSIQWESAFIPLTNIRYPWSPVLVTMNTFGPQILSAIAVPLTVLWKRPIDSRKSSASKLPQQTSSSGLLLADVAQAASTHLLYYATISLATTAWAGWLRRHLMLYRIFCPRFMMGAALLLVVDLVMICFAVGGVRWSTISVGEVFGWA